MYDDVCLVGTAGAYEVAAMAAGGAIVATDAVLEGLVSNAYVLMRWGGRGWSAMHKVTHEGHT